VLLLVRKSKDEAGKININSATALSSHQQQQGVGTFETLLTDGGARGLPISAAFGRDVLLDRSALSDDDPATTMFHTQLAQ
jgi:hypothetical protein